MLVLTMAQVAELNEAADTLEVVFGSVEALVLVVKDDRGIEWSVVRQGDSWKVDTTKITKYSNGDRQVNVLL